MNENLNNAMIESWRAYWGSDDNEIPDPYPVFVRGFEEASKTLTTVIADLIELMERSDMEVFGENCHPVTNAE
jgi:hypothetical protein